MLLNLAWIVKRLQLLKERTCCCLPSQNRSSLAEEIMTCIYMYIHHGQRRKLLNKKHTALHRRDAEQPHSKILISEQLVGALGDEGVVEK